MIPNSALILLMKDFCKFEKNRFNFWINLNNLNNNRCTPKDNCDNQLDVRGANDDYDYYNDNSTPVCMDSSQVCCHKEKLLKNVREEKLCSDIADDGYRYHLNDNQTQKWLMFSLEVS